MKRKILSLMLTMWLIFSLFPVAVPAVSNFIDMPDGAYGKVLQKAVDNGLLVGDTDKIMPAAPLTRAQMAAIISRAFGAGEKADISAFSDVPADAWYYTAMQTAYQMGAFKGDGSRLLPEKDITREEAFVVIARVLKLTPAESLERSFADGDNVSSWAKGLVYTMVNVGYVNGDGTNLRLKETITRQDFATVFDKIIKHYVRTPGVVQSVPAGNVLVNVPEVTLKDLTIMGDLIIGEGVGNGNVTLDHVTVTGRTVVRGGGENSIHIKNNSQVGSLLISKTVHGAVRVAADKDCSVEFTYIDDGKDEVILEGTFESVSIGTNVPIVAKNAEISVVTVTAASASVKIDGTSHITAVEIREDATGAALEVSATAKVTKVASSAEDVSISGAGTLAEVIVRGNDTSVNTFGTKITVSEGTSGVSVNGNNVSGGNTTVTQNPVVSGGESSGGRSSSGGGDKESGPCDVSTFAALQGANSSSYVTSINITADLEITADITISKPVTIAKDITLTNSAALTVNNSFNLGAARLINNGSITVSNGASFRVYMSPVENNGTFTVAEGGRLELDRGGQFNNKSTLNNSGTIYIGIEGGGLNKAPTATTTNSGLIIVYGFLNGEVTDEGGRIENHVANPTDESSFLSALENNDIARIYIGGNLEITLNTDTSFTKKVEIDDGRLLINANVTIGGENGYLAIDGGTDDGDSRVIINEGKIMTVSDVGCIGISGELEVRGSLINNGEIAIAEDGVLYIEGGSVTNAEGATLTNNGGFIRLFSAATLTNNGTLQQDGGLLIVDVYGEDGCTPCSVIGTLLNNQWNGRVAEINNASYLAQAINGDYSTVNLNVDGTTAANMTITGGTKFTIAEGATFTVAAETLLLAEETDSIMNNGTLQVNGSIELGATDLENAGSIIVAANASFGVYMSTLTNNGQVTVDTDGLLEMDRGGQFVNNGTLTNNGTVTVVQSNGGWFTNNGTLTGTELNIVK